MTVFQLVFSAFMGILPPKSDRDNKQSCYIIKTVTVRSRRVGKERRAKKSDGEAAADLLSVQKLLPSLNGRTHRAWLRVITVLRSVRMLVGEPIGSWSSTEKSKHEQRAEDGAG